MRFGLTRTPSPGLTGTSCYAMPWENGRVELHGAVVSWTAPQGVTGFVFCRDTCHIGLWNGPHPPIPGREQGTAGTIEERWSAFQPFLRWLVAYESWIHQTHGAEWRAGCWRAIKRLPKGSPWLPPQLAADWWQLATTSAPPRPKQLLRA